jgi:transaldolase
LVSASPARTATRALAALGQSPWLDFISRPLLDSGELARMVAEGWVTGVTSNPSIFEKAIAGSNDYAAALSTLAAQGVRDPYEAFTAIAEDDIREACDALLPVYQRTSGADGFVSLEVPPGIEADTARTVTEGKRLAALVGRPNVMIKVPGTPEGVRAVPALIAAGVNVNVTLLFAVSAYEATAAAYLQGLEQRLQAGLPLGTVASVASFFVSRLDTAVDPLLEGAPSLRGRIAVANARRAYGRFLAIFSGPRWSKLAAAGARPQRPLWASTGTKNPAYSDILYVEELIAPYTVNTMPEATLRAVLDHLKPRLTLEAGIQGAEAELSALAAAGVDLDAVTDRLLIEGLAAFERDFQKLLNSIASALGA